MMERSEQPQPMNQVEFNRYMDEMMHYRSRSNNQNTMPPPLPPPIVTPNYIMPPVTPTAIILATPPPMMPATPATQTHEQLYLNYQKENSKTGYLKVQAFTARRTYPVPEAVVEVSQNFPSGRYLITRLVTDQSGATPLISLPTPDKILSETPGNTHLFTRVDVKVKHKGFVETNFLDVPVFQDITSNQIADLLPIAAARDGMNSIDIVEHEPTDL